MGILRYIHIFIHKNPRYIMYPYNCCVCKRPYKTSDWDLSIKPHLVCYLCKEEGWKEMGKGNKPPKKSLTKKNK